MDRLRLVVDVRVLGHRLAILRQVFEDDQIMI